VRGKNTVERREADESTKGITVWTNERNGKGTSKKESIKT
jgi:hypothetical protein